MKTFTNLVISGGAFKVIAIIGSIKYLEEINQLDQFTNFVGVSSGSIMSLLLVLGYKHKEILEFFVHFMNNPLSYKLNPENLFDIFTTYGINDGKIIETILEKVLFDRLKVKAITFSELKRITGKNLSICVANLSKEKYEFFDAESMPNLNVITSIRISCSLPLIFTPITLNNDYYIDGGIYNNFPFNYFNDEQLKNTIGIHLKYDNYRKTDNFISYMRFIINSLIKKANNNFKNDKHNIIAIEFEEDSWFSLLDLEIQFPKEKFVKYINRGYQTFKDKYLNMCEDPIEEKENTSEKENIHDKQEICVENETTSESTSEDIVEKNQEVLVD